MQYLTIQYLTQDLWGSRVEGVYMSPTKCVSWLHGATEHRSFRTADDWGEDDPRSESYLSSFLKSFGGSSTTVE